MVIVMKMSEEQPQRKLAPCVFWLYGLSGSGKTTLSRLAAAELSSAGIPCLILDGDDFRSGISSDLGFSAEDRTENIRRAAEIAELACRQGLVVLAAFITPEIAMRDMARRIISSGPFFEVYLSCNYETFASRDVKGLYRKASEGALRQFTGKDSAFEPPVQPDLAIDSGIAEKDQCISDLRAFILEKCLL